jgi:hypothetical protein
MKLNKKEFSFLSGSFSSLSGSYTLLFQIIWIFAGLSYVL